MASFHARGACLVSSAGFFLAASMTGACGSSSDDERDAAVDAPEAIDSAGLEAAAPAIAAVDFTASGCEPLSTDGSTCTGSAPLALTFVPVTTGSVTQVLWDFGDGTPQDTTLTPAHTYPIPGRYTVTLVGGGGAGTASKTRMAFVVVTSNGVGQPCDVDVQCDASHGLTCLCGSSATGCSAAFARGLCSVSCRDMACASPGVCIDFSLAGPTAPAEPWRRPICLSTCASDNDCSSGLHCRSLPGRMPAGGWQRACFVDEPADPGRPCRDPSGTLQDSACATGLCAPLGALGECSALCNGLLCPADTACAVLASGESYCLRACGPTFSCNEDPLLDCEAPGGAGPNGFTVTNVQEGTLFCAPKTCKADGDCGAVGVCARTGAVGNCRLRTQ